MNRSTTTGDRTNQNPAIQLVDHGQGVTGKSPFVDDARFRSDWWNRFDWPGRRRGNMSAYLAGVEVARLVLNDDIELPHYPGFPVLGPVGLEIGFFEVAVTERLRGVGTDVVRALGARFPERRLVALSEAADGFWASLGWQPFSGPDEAYRSAYLQPRLGEVGRSW